MMQAVVAATRKVIPKPFEASLEAVNCHHNYVQKGALRPRGAGDPQRRSVGAEGPAGHHPGSMGAKSFIVRGLGNEESFCSCSHGAGRAMSRTRAKKPLHRRRPGRATAHVECRKDKDVIDEIPMAYKDIDAVMLAQRELVEVVHTLRQVVCVKG
jgi:tRNA-splicing ligase RtcB